MSITPEAIELAQRTIALAFRETRCSDTLVERLYPTVNCLLASQDVKELIADSLADKECSDERRLALCMAVAFISGASWALQMNRAVGGADERD